MCGSKSTAVRLNSPPSPAHVPKGRRLSISKALRSKPWRGFGRYWVIGRVKVYIALGADYDGVVVCPRKDSGRFKVPPYPAQ